MVMVMIAILALMKEGYLVDICIIYADDKLSGGNRTARLYGCLPALKDRVAHRQGGSGS